MKQMWADFFFALVMGLLVPALVLAVMLNARQAKQMQDSAQSTLDTYMTDEWIRISVLDTDGTVQTMDMDEYLVGVILREMPPEFEQEARMAQAVVARTYALRRNTVSAKHEGGAVCTDSACCQAYISPEAYLASGGSQQALEDARRAAMDTSGLVLVYQGTLAEATYFSCSGGRTEDAAAVWGADVPYLRSVDSPGEEEAAHYTDTVTMTPEAFCDALGIGYAAYSPDMIGQVTYTQGDGVESMEIGGIFFTGKELRNLLDLRSTAITITVLENAVVICTKGFGHRVGMSQYGADAMAVDGNTFEQILSHYYPGTELADWIDKAG